MQPLLIRKLKTGALICLFTSFAGVLFQLISEERLNQNSVLVGFPLGLVFVLLELFLFPRAGQQFRRWSFVRMLLVKTGVYTAVIYMVTICLMILAGFV